MLGSLPSARDVCRDGARRQEASVAMPNGSMKLSSSPVVAALGLNVPLTRPPSFASTTPPPQGWVPRRQRQRPASVLEPVLLQV